MADRTTFYAYAGTVARIVHDADGMHVDLWSKRLRAWVPMPGILGYLTGLGGDPPADPIDRDEAKKLLTA